MTVSTSLLNDPVLTDLRAALDRVFGARIERVVLYGSRARGDHGADSDYDVLVFLHELDDLWGTIRQIGPIAMDLLDREGAMVHVLPYPAGAHQNRTPLMHEVRRDGIDL
jgi:predicted nucleotidyltransferase